MTEFFEFQSRTKILSGRGALLHLAAEIRLLGGSRAILISDETLKHLGMTDRIAAVLLEEEICGTDRLYRDSYRLLSVHSQQNRRYLPKKRYRYDHRAGWRFCYRHSKGSAHDSVTEL